MVGSREDDGEERCSLVDDATVWFRVSGRRKTPWQKWSVVRAAVSIVSVRNVVGNALQDVVPGPALW